MTLAQSCVGIDVARAHLDMFDDSCRQTVRIANEPAAIAAFLASLAGRETTVVFEATGPYDRALRAALATTGIAAIRVNPARARDFARAAGYLAKTDAIDARMLAAMGRAIALPVAEPVDPAREQLAALGRQRDRLVGVRAEEKKRSAQSRDRKVCASIARHITWLTAEIANLEAAIAALAGLAPLNNDSGERRGRRSIKGGRRHVRRVLYMAALAAIRAVPRFAAAYAAIAKPASSKKVAIIAVARKLLVALNAMLATHQLFRA